MKSSSDIFGPSVDSNWSMYCPNRRAHWRRYLWHRISTSMASGSVSLSWIPPKLSAEGDSRKTVAAGRGPAAAFPARAPEAGRSVAWARGSSNSTALAETADRGRGRLLALLTGMGDRGGGDWSPEGDSGGSSGPSVRGMPVISGLSRSYSPPSDARNEGLRFRETILDMEMVPNPAEGGRERDLEEGQLKVADRAELGRDKRCFFTAARISDENFVIIVNSSFSASWMAMMLIGAWRSAASRLVSSICMRACSSMWVDARVWSMCRYTFWKTNSVVSLVRRNSTTSSVLRGLTASDAWPERSLFRSFIASMMRCRWRSSCRRASSTFRSSSIFRMSAILSRSSCLRVQMSRTACELRSCCSAIAACIAATACLCWAVSVSSARRYRRPSRFLARTE
mmetsp:Transcript_32023/g.57408  ORF Transcript_32023/g.57408 Transcript_32023/m.57408 type:complete len:397 (-) Transcript_32023:156-1346(-)